MTDLTKITTPFGLLDEAIQKELRECGGPWEFMEEDGEWLTLEDPSWYRGKVYRQKPPPPKPREWWAAFVGDMNYGMWPCEDLAHNAMRDVSSIYKLVHVREVIE